MAKNMKIIKIIGPIKKRIFLFWWITNRMQIDPYSIRQNQARVTVVFLCIYPKIKKILINESDLNKILSVRSDYLTIEYIIVIIDKIFPGYRERIKEISFNKLSENKNLSIY